MATIPTIPGNMYAVTGSGSVTADGKTLCTGKEGEQVYFTAVGVSVEVSDESTLVTPCKTARGPQGEPGAQGAKGEQGESDTAAIEAVRGLFEEHAGNVSLHLGAVEGEGGTAYMANESNGGIMKFTKADGSVGKVTLFDGSDADATFVQLVAHTGDKASIARVNISADGVYYTKGEAGGKSAEAEVAVKGDVAALEAKLAALEARVAALEPQPEA